VIVLDASALLALLLDEPGAGEVAARLDEASMSTVNLAEVLSKSEERGGDAKALLSQIARTPIEMLPLSVGVALGAARLRPKTKTLGFSLGDRICLALAQELDCEAWTADKRWLDAKLNVPVHLIR
jgi:PIN domain nuclease of toxin-antitoxin system